MRYCVIVPSFNDKSLNNDCHLFKKLNDSYVLDVIYESYSVNIGTSFDLYIVINTEQTIPLSLKCKDKIHVIRINKSDGLLFTLRTALKKIELDKYDSLVINFGDTVVYDNLKEVIDNNSEFSLISNTGLKSELSEIYTYLKLNKDGRLISIMDKINLKTENMKSLSLFIGVIFIKQVGLFMSCLSHDESFIGAYAKFSSLINLRHLNINNWYDVGHDIEYEEARVDVAARYFNEIYVDKDRGILRKTSANKDKFIDEILWYLRLPKDLSYISPRIYDWSIEYSMPFIEMELYGYRTLHEIYITDCSSVIEQRKWGKIFDRLLTQIEDMQAHRIRVSREQYYKSIYEMYVEKTITRLEKVKSDKQFEIFFNNKININGIYYPSLDKVIKYLKMTL